jgi:predicted  nucleic acid-binding Zn-ribbon protein
MRADPKDQQRLLDVQAIDTALQQLAHRKKNLPELAEIAGLTKVIGALEDERARAEVNVDDLDRDIARLEREVEAVRQRRNRDNERMVDGRLPARELTALEHEVQSLTRRQSELEDAELELMEKRETAQAALDSVDAKIASARERREATEAKRDLALTEIAKEEEWKIASRRPLIADLPADLVELYDKIREQSGGLGAALVRHGQCGGCRLELYGADRARVKAAAPDEVLRCEECRRIMVRTAESGL